MPAQTKNPLEISQKKESLVGRISIYIIQITSNFFWKVVDTFSYKSPKMAKLYTRYIGREYISEYKSIGVKKDNKVLHIGCGPFPLTEISLVKQFGALVVGIDKNPKIINMAKDIVNQNNLAPQIIIQHGDGVDYPVNDFDMIIISSCASPKNQILENILHHAKKDCIIVIRELDISMDEIHSTIQKHKNVEIIKQTHHHPLPLVLQIPWTSLAIKIK